MIFRRILAVILVFVFIVSSLAAFLVYAFSNTFFRQSFYEEDISRETYEFMVGATVKNLIKENSLISEHFTEADLRREIMSVFPETIFQKTVRQLISDMDSLKQDPSKPLTLKLGTYRESLLTLAHNMSYNLFESLPKCAGAEIPEEAANGLPSCVPPGVEYNMIAAPFSEEFEKSVYAAVPEQVQIDLNATVGEGGFMLSGIFQAMDTAKVVIYGILLLVLVFIALLIWKPFASILSFEGAAFFLGGLGGVLLSYVIFTLSPVLAEKLDGELLKDDIRVLLDKIMSLFSAEIQKAAYIFLALGAVLVLTRLFMKKR